MFMNELPRFKSEADKMKSYIIPYCKGNGIDVACGGSKIISSAIGIDLPQDKQYANVGDDSVQLRGDGRNLYWFKNSVLDYVASSHMLEDYPEEETLSILEEWTRVLKVGGYLVLSLPHEPKFYHHCVVEGKQLYNYNHKCKKMSPEYIEQKSKELGNLEKVLISDVEHVYCFVAVFKKVS